MKGKDCYCIYSGGIARGGCVAAGMKFGSGPNMPTAKSFSKSLIIEEVDKL